MKSIPDPRPSTHVIPQVGAILHLDTALKYPDTELGNKHWALDGSCVLVAADRILTIRHTLIKTGKKAAFFPYEGIFPIEEERIEDFDYGDTLCLCRLEEPVRFAPPLPYEYISRTKLESALVAGFGRWANYEGWEHDGVQRSVEVKLHMPSREEGGPHYDNLDICWWSAWNQDLAAGRNNSGGPVLLERDDRSILLGLTREAKDNQQAASRITDDRGNQWLPRELRRVSSKPLREAVDVLEPRDLSIRRGRGETVSIEAPEEATEIHLTLSATPGLRLQMGVTQGGGHESLLQDLAASDRNSGRFLYRHEKLRAGDSRELTIGVVPVAQAPARADRVQAQLCCLFSTDQV